MPKDKLINLYHSMETSQLDALLVKSSGQELNRFLSHMSERNLNDLFSSQSPKSLNAIFERIPENRINKYLSQSAFKEIQQVDFQPQTLDKLKDIIGLMKTGESQKAK
ncbi:hypothetical protein [Vibrio cholerae]|uniref:hypothetical protein n=1 Tax=Vibrio cholerae TaxID=666 RepID=UPI00163C4DC9|nr:hypothetical protein [Vibrio cholerae]